MTNDKLISASSLKQYIKQDFYDDSLISDICDAIDDDPAIPALSLRLSDWHSFYGEPLPKDGQKILVIDTQAIDDDAPFIWTDFYKHDNDGTPYLPYLGWGHKITKWMKWIPFPDIQ